MKNQFILVGIALIGCYLIFYGVLLWFNAFISFIDPPIIIMKLIYGLLFVGLGIGLLLRRNAARVWIVIISIIGIIAGLALVMCFKANLLTQLIKILFSVAVIYYLTRAKVKEQFK